MICRVSRCNKEASKQELVVQCFLSMDCDSKEGRSVAWGAGCPQRFTGPPKLAELIYAGSHDVALRNALSPLRPPVLFASPSLTPRRRNFLY